MPRDMDSEGAARLEGLIDTHTLAEVLNTIAGICAAKAQHIRENWQPDTSLARLWDRLGVTVSATADDAETVGL